MYTNVSTECINALNADGRRFGAKITLSDKTEITDGFYSIDITSSANNDTEKMQLGTAIATQVTVNMEEPTSVIYNKEFLLSLGIYIDDTTIEYVPMGYFKAQKPTVQAGKMTFTALDRMARLNGNYSSLLSYPCDIADVVKEIQTMTGVPIEIPGHMVINKRVESDDGTTITYCNPFEGYTYKETLAIIASYYGRFVTVDRTGKVVFRDYRSRDYQITADRSLEDISVSNEIFNLGYIKCTVDNDLILKSGNGATGVTISCFMHTQDTLDNLYDSLKELSYYPASVSFLGDFRLDIGDMVTVITLDGTGIILPIMGMNIEFDGGLTSRIYSYGETSETAEQQSPTEKAISRLYQQLAVVENLIATKSVTIGQVGTTNLLDDSLTLINDDYTIEIIE